MPRVDASRAEAVVHLHDALIAEHHTPGRIGVTAPKFAIDEIGDASEEQADRRGRGGDIAQPQQVDFFAPRFRTQLFDIALLQPADVLHLSVVAGMIARRFGDGALLRKRHEPVSYTHLTLPTSD